MPKKNRHAARLGDRDYEILEHLTRYRLTTRDALHRLFFNDSEPNAVTKVTSRLVRARFLNRFDLPLGRSYFVIGPNAARLFGLSERKCGAMGPQSLLENLGMLYFCCMGQVQRERLLVHEVVKHLNLGQIPGKHLQIANFYLDAETEARCLAHMRVDQGGPAAHIVRKCKAFLETVSQNPTLFQLIRHQRFMLAIITLSETKARDIREAVTRQPWPVQFRIEAVPSLDFLLANREALRLDDSMRLIDEIPPDFPDAQEA